MIPRRTTGAPSFLVRVTFRPGGTSPVGADTNIFCTKFIFKMKPSLARCASRGLVRITSCPSGTNPIGTSAYIFYAINIIEVVSGIAAGAERVAVEVADRPEGLEVVAHVREFSGRTRASGFRCARKPNRQRQPHTCTRSTRGLKLTCSRFEIARRCDKLLPARGQTGLGRP